MPEYLSKINPKWRTKKDIDYFVVAQGGIPEFLVYEMGLQKEFQNTKGKNFLADSINLSTFVYFGSLIIPLLIYFLYGGGISGFSPILRT